MRPLKDQNYIALDLELNSPQNGQPPRIIQVGVAIGSPIDPDTIDSYYWYLDPEEPITPEITRLTGITDDDIRIGAVSHESLALELGGVIDRQMCFVNPITWGQGDVLELKREFAMKGVHFPYFGRRIFDVKTMYVFEQMAKGVSVAGGLRKAMGAYGLKFVGNPHRADFDALNTLRFFFFLLRGRRTMLEAINTLTKT